MILAAVALVLGLVAGFGIARATSSSVADQVATVRAQVRETTGGLRVLALHAQAHVGGTSDVRPVLERARAGLDAALTAAPWIGPTTGRSLLDEVRLLGSMAPGSSRFATSVARAADHIDQAFGIAAGTTGTL